MKQDAWPENACFKDRVPWISGFVMDAHMAADGVTFRTLRCLVTDQSIPERDAVSCEGLSFYIEAVLQNQPGPSRAAASYLGAGNCPLSNGPARCGFCSAQVTNRALANSKASREESAEKQDKQGLFFPTRDDSHLFVGRLSPPGIEGRQAQDPTQRLSCTRNRKTVLRHRSKPTVRPLFPVAINCPPIAN